MEEQHVVEALQVVIQDMGSDALAEVLYADPDLHVTDEDVPNVQSVRTFDEVGMLTMNSGLVVTFDNGAEFQLTIVRSA